MTETKLTEESMMDAFNKLVKDREEHISLDKNDKVTLRSWLAKVTDVNVDEIPKDDDHLEDMYNNTLKAIDILLEDLTKVMNKERLAKLNSGKN